MSGLSRTPGKRVYGESRTAGSNPALSASQQWAPPIQYTMSVMNESTPVPPRRRLQELLAIPERDRTEAQWDELNELEITLASSNRDQGGQQRMGQGGQNQGGQNQGGQNPGGHGKPGNRQRGKRPQQQQFKRRQPKPNR